ncbi:MAG: hypothetical protein M0013_12680 [Actinomycetota bacterium]|nr:hypothetical protein [Actinomycetota bacterium]
MLAGPSLGVAAGLQGHVDAEAGVLTCTACTTCNVAAATNGWSAAGW